MKRFIAALMGVLLLGFITANPSAAISTSLHVGQGGFVFNPGGWDGVAEWITIPHVSTACNTSDQLAPWVGLQSAGSSGLPFTQNGLSITESNTITGAWYEYYFPDGSTNVVTVPFSASPGDQVLLREIWGVNHSNLWFVWTNETTGDPAVVREISFNSLYDSSNGMFGELINEDPTFNNGNNGSPLPWFGRIDTTNARVEQNNGSSNNYGADGTPRPTSITYVNNADQKWNMARTKPHSGEVRVDSYRFANDATGWYAVQDTCT